MWFASWLDFTSASVHFPNWSGERLPASWRTKGHEETSHTCVFATVVLVELANAEVFLMNLVKLRKPSLHR